MKIVVSRYNEDINWIKFLNYKYIIYNKGEDIELDNIKLPNIGRESHTYLYHIINNYNNLDEITVFLQGNPFDHSNDLFNSIFNYNNENFYNLCNWIVDCDLNGCPNHCGLEIVDFYQKIFNKDVDFDKLTFGAGAQFIVNKNSILKHPKSFYENILTLLDYSINPIEAYIIERLWHKIFI
jgi:hypothetical protein